MPQGNGNRAKQRRERNQAQAKSNQPKSQLKANAAAQTLICKICKQSFMCVSSVGLLTEHQEAKHPKLTYLDCFDKTE